MTEIVVGPEPDWDKLRAENPDEFARAWSDYSFRKRDLEVVQKRRAEELEKLKAASSEEHKKYLETQGAQLREKWPEFMDPKTSTATFKKVHDFMTERYGVTADELASFTDHRFFLLVRDAMEGHEIKAKSKQKLKGNLKEAPKALPPGARKPVVSKGAPAKGQKELAGLQQRLRRTGRSDDAVSLVERMLDI
jgi:hypothetical protein